MSTHLIHIIVVVLTSTQNLCLRANIRECIPMQTQMLLYEKWDVRVYITQTSRYLDDLLNIDNPYFEGMVNQIYPPELQLNKANTSDTEAPFLDLHLSISNGFVSSKNDKRDDFDFDIYIYMCIYIETKIVLVSV